MPYLNLLSCFSKPCSSYQVDRPNSANFIVIIDIKKLLYMFFYLLYGLHNFQNSRISIESPISGFCNNSFWGPFHCRQLRQSKFKLHLKNNKQLNQTKIKFICSVSQTVAPMKFFCGGD